MTSSKSINLSSCRALAFRWQNWLFHYCVHRLTNSQKDSFQFQQVCYQQYLRFRHVMIVSCCSYQAPKQPIQSANPAIITTRALLSRYMPWSCVCPSVCVSVCPSQVGVLLKQLNVGTRKQRHTIAQGLQFSDAKNLFEIRTGSPPTGAPNTGGVGRSWRISTNNSPYLGNGTRQTHRFY